MADLENMDGEDHMFAVQGIHDDDSKVTHDNSSKITKLTHDDEYIQFGNERYLKSELMEAFGGNMQPGLAPPPKHDFGNPAPLGLSGFALTTFVLSLINCGARGVTTPNIVVGLAFFYGGAAQVFAGLFEIASGNTFGGVAFTSYAGFWGSFAALYVNSFGIQDAYKDENGELLTEFSYAVGIYLIGWFIFTFFMMLMTLKSTVAFFSIFFFLSITYLLLAIAEFSGKESVKVTGGVFGLITAFAAWYNAYAGLSNPQNSYITVKAIHLPDLQEKFHLP